MTRPRYPSDKRPRPRTRPHVKVHLSLRGHERYGAVFDDLEMRSMLVGLWMLGVQHYAPKTDDHVSLSHGELTWLSGRTHRRHGVNALRRLCGLMGYTMRDDGKRVVVHIRNLAQKQGFRNAERADSVSDSASLRGTPETPYTEHRTQSTEHRTQNTEEVLSALSPNGDDAQNPPEGFELCEPPARSRDPMAGFNKARMAYLPGAKALKSGPARARLAAAVIRDYGPTAPVDAVHGYVIAHIDGGNEKFRPEKHMVPETIWSASKVAKYLDADAAAVQAGLKRPYTKAQVVEPFHPDPKGQARKQMFRQILEEAKTRA